MPKWSYPGKAKARSLSDVAQEISDEWEAITPRAAEWLDAMFTLDSVSDAYYEDSGRLVVSRFLSLSEGWHGDVAQRVKKELQHMLAVA